MSTDKEEKKSLFDRLIDMVSTRDEKEAVEVAQQEVVETQKQADDAVAQAEAASAEQKAAADKALADANAKAKAAEIKARELEKQMAAKKKSEAAAAAAQASQERREEMAAREKAAAAPKFIATHTLTSKETLSHLALEYYGHATPPYWKLIYEANKEVIGDNPNKVRPGLEIKIPELPEELKD